MKCCIAGMLLAASLPAQEAPSAIVRGTLTLADAGVLEVRPPVGTPVRCGFDSHTWIEQDRKRLQLNALEPGVAVELLTDMRMGRCYTRTVRIVPSALNTIARRPPLAPMRNVIENIYPRGNLTFGGVVIRRSPTVLILRTRTEPEKLIRLRDDTRFLDSGSPATAADVAVNTRVFVRAGKNFDNDIEAYQVIWGEISGPVPMTSQ